MTSDKFLEPADLGSNIWQLMASAWELAAFSFRYPNEELFEAVSSGEWADAILEISSVLNLDFEQDSGIAQIGSSKSVTSLSALRTEATRLFIGAPSPLCSPYEGIWRAEDEGVQGLLFVNSHSM